MRKSSLAVESPALWMKARRSVAADAIRAREKSKNWKKKTLPTQFVLGKSPKTERKKLFRRNSCARKIQELEENSTSFWINNKEFKVKICINDESWF